MYGKIFKQIYKGTLAMVGPWEALVTFQQLIILADKDGVVDMTADAISRETTIPLKIIEKGIAALEAPDPESRTPDEEGRRIVRLSDDRTWGWRIVNYAYYRKLRNEEERREYHRQYWHKRKEKPGEMEKISARRKMNNAITAGKLHLGPCEVCGSTIKIEGHHDDYSKPLEVRWLCHEHHVDEHRPQQPSTNTTNSSKQKAVSRKQGGSKTAPRDFSVTESMYEWADSELGLSTKQVHHETAVFMDHEFARPRKDWQAVWRNWMRRSKKWSDDEARKQGRSFDDKLADIERRAGLR